MPAISYPPRPSSVAATLPDWSSASKVYTVDDKVMDPTIDVVFKCLVGHTTTATDKPPCQDPTRWLGADVKELGKVVTMGHMRDAGPLKAMTASRNISRSTYVRLMNTIAPLKTNVNVTSGSSIILMDAGEDADIPVGATIELPGVPAGTLVGAKSTPGSKVATVDVNATFPGNATDGYGGPNYMFFKPGALAAGYQFGTPMPLEFSGPGEGGGGNSRITSVTADSSATLTTNSTTSLIGATNVSALNNVLRGDYVSGVGIPPNTRLARWDKQVAASANGGIVAASNQLFMGPDFYNLVDPTMLLPGRLVTASPTNIAPAGAQSLSATPIVSPPTVLGGDWSYVSTGTWLLSPWDVAPADVALIVSNRRFAIDASPAAQQNYVSGTINPVVSRNGAVNAGLARFFWRVGEAVLPGVTVERRIGNSSGAMPALAYVASHAIEAVQPAAQSLTNLTPGIENTLFTTIGGTANGQVGQFVTLAAAGFNQARILSIQPEASYAFSGGGGLPDQNQIFLQPGVPPSQLRIGQRANTASVTAFITNIGADIPIPAARIVNGSTNVWLPIGTLIPQNRVKMRSTGYVSSATNFVNGNTVQATLAGGETNLGYNTIVFAPGSGLTVATHNNRFVQSDLNHFPANTFATTVNIDQTVTTVRAGPLFAPALFFNVATAIAPAVPGARFTMPTSYPGGGVIAAGGAVTGFSANCRTVISTNQLYLPVGTDWTKINRGQLITGNANIPANTVVGPPAFFLPGATPAAYETPLAKATVINGQSVINVPVGWAPLSFTPAANAFAGGTSIATNTIVTGLGAEAPVTALGPVAAGSNTMPLPANAVITAWTRGRYVANANLPADTRIQTVVASGGASGGLNANVSPTEQKLFVPTNLPTTYPLITTGVGIIMPGNPVPASTIVTGPFVNAVGTYGATTGTGGSTVFVDPGAVLFRGQMVSSASITAPFAGISNINPEVTLIGTINPTDSTFVRTGGPVLTVADIGRRVGPNAAFPAGASIVAVAGNNIALSTNSATAETSMTFGAILTITSTGNSNNTNATIQPQGYYPLNVSPTGTNIATAGAGGAVTLGPQLVFSANATGPIVLGDAMTLGRQFPTSLAISGADALDTAGVSLGGAIPLSSFTNTIVNATGTATGTATTFNSWAPVTTAPAASSYAAPQTASFGASIVLSAPATGAGAGQLITFGPGVTMGAATASPTQTVTDAIFGATITMSGIASVVISNNSNPTFNRWAIVDQLATVAVTAGAATYGAVSTLNAPATANDATPATFGMAIPTAGTALTTARTNTNARVGAILQLAANNTAGSTNGETITFGPIGVMSNAATASGTPTLTFGGHALVDTPFISQNNDATYNFGIGITMARAIIPGCTFTPDPALNSANRTASHLSASQVICYDTSNIVVGQPITGPGIPGLTTVTSIVSSTRFNISNNVSSAQADVTLIQPVNATASSATASGRFFPYGAGSGSGLDFGIGVDTAGRGIVVGGANEPVSAKWGAKSSTMLASQMPKHNHHDATLDNNIVGQGKYGFTRLSTFGESSTATGWDNGSSGSEPDIFNSNRAPYDEGSGNPIARSSPVVAAACGLAMYVGAA